MKKLVVQEQALVCFNFPYHSDQIELGTVAESMMEALPPSVYDPDVHTLVYNANMNILALDQIEHTKSDIEKLNTNGLDIWLFEPLCGYYVDDPAAPHWNKHNAGFYSEFTPQVHPEENLYRARELDSIRDYALKWNLTNVRVHTGDYEADRFFPFYADTIKVLTDDLFLRALSLFDNFDISAKTRFKTRFICTTWRWTPVRQLVNGLLANKSAMLSWTFKADADVLDDNLWAKDISADLKAAYLEGLAVLNDQVPLTIDLPVSKYLPITRDPGDHYPKIDNQESEWYNPVIKDHEFNPVLNQAYRDCFMAVVVESRYAQPTANLSEKFQHAVKYKTPFLLVGPPRSLEYLRSLGYRTFSDWWDEDYDEIEDHAERLAKIYEIISWIESLSMTELFEMYKQMIPILEHNLRVAAKQSRWKKLMRYVFKETNYHQVWYQGDQDLLG